MESSILCILNDHNNTGKSWVELNFVVSKSRLTVIPWWYTKSGQVVQQIKKLFCIDGVSEILFQVRYQFKTTQNQCSYTAVARELNTIIIIF